MKKFEILQELSKCNIETQNEQILLEKKKMVSIDLLVTSLPQTFLQFVKNKTMQYLWITIMGNAIKWGNACIFFKRSLHDNCLMALKVILPPSFCPILDRIPKVLTSLRSLTVLFSVIQIHSILEINLRTDWSCNM